MAGPTGLTPQLSAFNEELASICSDPPPVTKSKMQAITDKAIKATKTYKHVVQNVEKFISKSEPRYKLAGLYVMDSIIRSSRHKNGPEKDVYAPRFQKNIIVTFQHLARSSMPKLQKEKTKKVIRYWRVGTIYPAVITDSLDKIIDSAINQDSGDSRQPESTEVRNDDAQAPEANELIQQILANPNSEMAKSLTKMMDGEQRTQLESILENMQKEKISEENETPPPSSPPPSEDHDKSWDSERLTPKKERHNSGNWNDSFNRSSPSLNISSSSMNGIQNEIPPVWNSGPPPLVPPVTPIAKGRNRSRDRSRDQSREDNIVRKDDRFSRSRRSRSPTNRSNNRRSRSPRRRSKSRSREKRRRSGSRTKDRSREHRSRDGERDRSRRSRSRERSRRDRRSKSRDRARSRRDDEKSNREKLCLPPKQPNKGCIASRTIWIGNLSKSSSRDTVRQMIVDISSDEQVENIDFFPSRGCAYVVMKSRSSAFKALQELFSSKRRDEKRKVDWAINSGVKNDKIICDFFNKTEGACFIPYDKLPTDIQELKQLATGGLIDIESMPENIQKDLQSQTATIPTTMDMDMDMDVDKEGITAALQMIPGLQLPNMQMPNMTMPMMNMVQPMRPNMPMQQQHIYPGQARMPHMMQMNAAPPMIQMGPGQGFPPGPQFQRMPLFGQPPPNDFNRGPPVMGSQNPPNQMGVPHQPHQGHPGHQNQQGQVRPPQPMRGPPGHDQRWPMMDRHNGFNDRGGHRFDRGGHRGNRGGNFRFDSPGRGGVRHFDDRRHPWNRDRSSPDRWGNRGGRGGGMGRDRNNSRGDHRSNSRSPKRLRQDSPNRRQPRDRSPYNERRRSGVEPHGKVEHGKNWNSAGSEIPASHNTGWGSPGHNDQPEGKRKSQWGSPKAERSTEEGPTGDTSEKNIDVRAEKPTHSNNSEKDEIVTQSTDSSVAEPVPVPKPISVQRSVSEPSNEIRVEKPAHQDLSYESRKDDNCDENTANIANTNSDVPQNDQPTTLATIDVKEPTEASSSEAREE